MTDDGVLEIHRTDPLSAALDQVFRAIHDPQIAVLVYGDHIPGAQPAVLSPLITEFRQIEITRGYPGPAQLHFTHGFSVTASLALVANDSGFNKRHRGPLHSPNLILFVLGHVAQVIAVPHPKWDERPLAVVVAAEPKPPPEELNEFLAKRFAKWQLPDAYIFVEELPHTSTGKLLKSALRDRYKDYLNERFSAAR